MIAPPFFMTGAMCEGKMEVFVKIFLTDCIAALSCASVLHLTDKNSRAEDIVFVLLCIFLILMPVTGLLMIWTV